MKPLRALYWIALGWFFSFFFFLILVPLLHILAQVTQWRMIFDPAILAIVKITVYQATVSTAFSLGFGIPLGIWVGRIAANDSRGHTKWIRGFLSVPFGVPTLVAATAWVLLLGRSGYLAQLGIRADFLYSFRAVVLAHTIFNIPWVAFLVSQSSERISDQAWEAASTLGANLGKRLRYVALPAIWPAIISAASQVFAFCMMSFILVMILGGGPPIQTLETSIYTNIRYGHLDLSQAIACAVWELVLTLGPWVIYVALKNGEKLPDFKSQRAKRYSKFSFYGALGVSVLLCAPYFSVLMRESNRLLWSGKLLAEISHPLILSIKIALLSGLGALSFALAACFLSASSRTRFTQNLFSWVAILPTGISVLVLGLGTWLAYGEWIDPFEGSLSAIIAIQSALFSPVAFRVLWPILNLYHPAPLEAATTLGASTLRAFYYVEWPRWRQPIVSAFAVVAGASLGEVAAVSLFYNENLIPLPLLISRKLSQYQFEEAQAVSACLLVISSFIIFWASTRGNAVGRRLFYGITTK